MDDGKPDDRLAVLERQIMYLYAHFGLDPAAADQVELPVPSSQHSSVTARRSQRSGTIGAPSTLVSPTQHAP